MPIFKDPDHQEPSYQPSSYPVSSAETGSSYTRGEPMERAGHLGDEQMLDTPSSQREMDTEGFPKLQTSDREELIRRIKRGESPTWVPNPSLERYFATHGDHPYLRVEGEPNKDENEPAHDLKDADQSPERKKSPESSLEPPENIQRPRSALHSGDFREGSPDLGQGSPPVAVSPPVRSYYGPSSPTHWQNLEDPRRSFNRGNDQVLHSTRARASVTRSRAPSFGSFSSSYVLKAPTSPLVYQANNPDLDFSPKIDKADMGNSVGKSNRRRTLPPETFQSFQASPQSSFGPRISWQREATFPLRSQPSQSSATSSYTLQPASSPQSQSKIRSRRQSFSLDGSPVHSPSHSSMVGSYEESILRGRMSTTPSKPLDFTAQIGVLGRGHCKSYLKCPPHVTVPFPAVFYSYPASGSNRSISDDSPSPYVGFIDIENSLAPEVRPRQKSIRRRHTSPIPCPHFRFEGQGPFADPVSPQQERRVREKRARRSHCPQAPPGGCYRIPQQGQIQIIIKNPNKTAVKLFLVPYDLEGMEPGTKTFLRQRSYSVGPIIEPTLTSQSPDTPKSPEGADDKPVLRYLVHLNICCTSVDRYYLYSGVRVVFANRVPDGKERLHNEIQYPEPRYSPYKPTKDTTANNKTTTHLPPRGQGPEYDNNIQIPLQRPALELRGTEQRDAGSPELLPARSNDTLPDLSGSGGNGDQQANEWFSESVSSSPNVPEGASYSPFFYSPIPASTRPQPFTPSPGFFHKLDTAGPVTPTRMPSRYGEGVESLISKKLKNLDVMKREFENQPDKKC